MLEQVEKKIEEFKKSQAKEYYKKKDADLEAWGLASKKEGKKNVPIIITNEEYEELIKASNGVGGTGRNKYAKVLNVLAIVVLVIGAIAGGAVLALSDDIKFVYFSLAMVVAGVFAAVLKGLSEAVRLLQQIVDARFAEAPEYSEEEVKAFSKKGNEVPAAQYGNYPHQAPAAPVAQPPIYHAAYPHANAPQHQYPAQPYAYPAQGETFVEDEMSLAYGAYGERGTEPQQF